MAKNLMRPKKTIHLFGWFSWVTMLFITASLGLILEMNLQDVLQERFGLAMVAAAILLGALGGSQIRCFGIWTGLVLPSVFVMAWAVNIGGNDTIGWKALAAALGILLVLLSGRVVWHLVKIAVGGQHVRLGRWVCFGYSLTLLAALLCGSALTQEFAPEVTPRAWATRAHILLTGWGILLILLKPTFLLRTLLLLLCKTLYRIELKNFDKIPDSGAVLLVSNHVSFLDALIIMGIKARKIHFMVHENFYRQPGLYWFFRWMGALEVPRANKPKQMQHLFDKVHRILEHGGAVCVFPEGSISANGIMQEIKTGLSAMLPADGGAAIPIIPIRLGMLWGSLFGIHEGKLKFIPPRKLPIPASVNVGDPIPHEWCAFQIWQRILELGAEAEMAPTETEKTLHFRLLKRCKQHPFQRTFQDAEEPKGIRNFSLLLRAAILSQKIRQITRQRQDSGDYIGLLLPNRVITITSFFAILFAGRSVAVLNFTAGPEAMRAMIAKAELKTILTSRKLLTKLRMEPLPEMVFLEEVAPTVSAGEKRIAVLKCLFLPWFWLIRNLSPENFRNVQAPAVVLFSSGSTGAPKGVMLSHHNLTSNVMSFWRTIAWRPSDRVLGNLPLFHAFGLMVCGCFPALTGTRVVYVANPLDATNICKTIREHKITLLMATPTFLQNYMHGFKPGDFDTLRMVVTGAEKLQRKLFERFKALTGLNIIEGYGCTEMSPIVSVNLSSSLFTLGKESGPFGSIGVPMPGIAVRVIDPDSGASLGENQPGLLLLKSPTTMLGYLNDDAATAAVMRGEYYNTNDIALIDRNGYIKIVGRLSRFSKIGGEMVPHEMVERRLEELTHLDNMIAVTARPDERKGEQLVVLYAAEEELNLDQLLEAMRESGLPNLWIPRRDCFFRVEELPMLGNGKKDLKKLQELAHAIQFRAV